MFTETFDCAYETFKNEVCVVCVRKWGADGRGSGFQLSSFFGTLEKYDNAMVAISHVV